MACHGMKILYCLQKLIPKDQKSIVGLLRCMRSYKTMLELNDDNLFFFCSYLGTPFGLAEISHLHQMVGPL